MEFLKTKGRFVYDPVRRNLKKTYKERTLIIDLPWDDLDLYYQWFLRKKYGTWFDHSLQTEIIFNEKQTTVKKIGTNIPCVARPMWGKHVTVVRGDEQGFRSSNWGKYNGQTIDVFYFPELKCSWKFWSIPIKGDGLFEIRKELGLKAFHNFHITIAREI